MRARGSLGGIEGGNLVLRKPHPHPMRPVTKPFEGKAASAALNPVCEAIVHLLQVRHDSVDL